jgi:uncharacterized protein (DUF433 family)
MINLMFRDGSVFIIDTDVAVWRVLMMLEDGLTEDQVHDCLPTLPRGAVKSAEVYYEVHREELDSEIASARKKQAAAG